MNDRVIPGDRARVWSWLAGWRYQPLHSPAACGRSGSSRNQTIWCSV